VVWGRKCYSKPTRPARFTRLVVLSRTEQRENASAVVAKNNGRRQRQELREPVSELENYGTNQRHKN